MLPLGAHCFHYLLLHSSHHTHFRSTCFDLWCHHPSINSLIHLYSAARDCVLVCPTHDAFKAIVWLIDWLIDWLIQIHTHTHATYDIITAYTVRPQQVNFLFLILGSAFKSTQAGGYITNTENNYTRHLYLNEQSILYFDSISFDERVWFGINSSYNELLYSHI